MDRYLSREEIAYRLPVSIPISQFWPAMEEARKKAAILLPLKAQNGQPFWFVINKTIEAQCDVVAEIAWRSFVFDELSEQIMEEATIDEAVWSSVIEGAFTSKTDAARIIRQDKMPANKSEQMIKTAIRRCCMCWIIWKTPSPHKHSLTLLVLSRMRLPMKLWMVSGRFLFMRPEKKMV